MCYLFTRHLKNWTNLFNKQNELWSFTNSFQWVAWIWFLPDTSAGQWLSVVSLLGCCTEVYCRSFFCTYVNSATTVGCDNVFVMCDILVILSHHTAEWVTSKWWWCIYWYTSAGGVVLCLSVRRRHLMCSCWLSQYSYPIYTDISAANVISYQQRSCYNLCYVCMCMCYQTVGGFQGSVKLSVINPFISTSSFYVRWRIAPLS